MPFPDHRCRLLLIFKLVGVETHGFQTSYGLAPVEKQNVFHRHRLDQPEVAATG